MFKAFVPGEGRSKGRCAVNWIFLIAGIALAGAALTWIVSYIIHAVRTGMDWAAVADDLIPNVVKTKNELSKCFVQTVQMVLFSSLISAGFGILFGVLLVVTQKGGILECPPVFQTLDKVINVFRSIPFIILVALLIKTTRNLVGTSIGVTGAVFPLVVATVPFFSRQIHAALCEIDPGVVEAARKLAVKVPLVVRLEGTNAEAGKEILAESGLNITAAEDMADGAEKACRLAKEAQG